MAEEKINRGEFLKQKIEETKYSVPQLTDELGIERTTIYKWFKNPDLDIDKLKKACDIIGIDLRDYFENIELIYGNLPEPITYQKRYFELLEKYTELLENHALYIKKFGDLSSQKRDISDRQDD